MLTRLKGLPQVDDIEQSLQNEGIIIKRPIAPEKSILIDWTRKRFSKNWADEVSVAFNTMPVNCFIAQKDQRIVGFACYECTSKNYFGPTGVIEEFRGRQIGKLLLIKSLNALKEKGYNYAIIGGVGPQSFYKKTIDAEIILNSGESIYQNLLKHK